MSKKKQRHRKEALQKGPGWPSYEADPAPRMVHVLFDADA